MAISKDWDMDIAIPQYKNKKMLERCLSSLSQISIPSNIDKIWVVENGGKHGAEEVIAKFQGKLAIEYLYIEEGNLSKARNAALKNTKSKLILFFDNDITFDNDTLSSYQEAISTYLDSNVAFFGGPLTPCYEKAPKSFLVPYLPWSVKGFRLADSHHLVSSPIFLGGNHGGVVELLRSVGGYDIGSAEGRNSGLVGEETRLMEKLLTKGYVGLYCAGGNAHHYIPSENCTIAWTLKRTFRHGLTDSLNSNEQPNKKLFGIPIYIYKMIVYKSVGVFFPGKRPRFYYPNKIAYLLGNAIGFRQKETKHDS